MARYGVGDFSSFVSCKKSTACLNLSEKTQFSGSYSVIVRVSVVLKRTVVGD